jgi:hypothetical protein
VQYLYSNWTDGGNQSRTISCPASNATYTANFTIQYYLAISAGSGGIANPASGWYNSGQNVGISATAFQGYGFSGWLGTGNGSYSGPMQSTTVTINSVISETASFAPTVQVSGDFNGDGHPDVLWQDPISGFAQIWLLGGAQGTSTLGAANITASNTWRIVGVGDFNRDGHPDTVWQDPVSGAAQVWFLGGANGNVVTGAATLSSGNTWRIRAVADFNGDGIPDCIWQDQVSGFAQIWFMGGVQGTVVIGSVNLTSTNTWRIVGAADFNKDGNIDVLWQDPATGATQIWYLGGAQHNAVTSAVNLTGSNAWQVAAVGDYNGDGNPDTIWQDPVTGASQILFLGGSNGASIQSATGFSGPNVWRIAGPR